MEHAYAVILAGGRGERFWPLSTSSRPKQFVSLFGDRPLLGMAVDRLEGLIPPERILIITSADLVEATREAASELPHENIVGEPFGRDTAPAVALAGALVKQRDPNGVFCILTADHIMEELQVYRQTLKDCMELASAEDVLITIGINPDSPSTGFGYIEAGEEVSKDRPTSIYKATRFVEKPDEATATEYLASGKFYWNAGMFIWSVDSLEKAFARHCTPLEVLMNELATAAGTDGFLDQLEKSYTACDRISVDYALMEHADNILVAKGTFVWDDVGAWPAVANHFPSDENGNVGVGAVESDDCNNNIIVSEDRLTALIGVEDLIVVQADGATLICHKDRAQEIKQMVQRLGKSGKYDELI